jgi:hypothetical protein
MLDKCLIEHCSPTLASLKTANLFSFSIKEGQDVQQEIQKLNREFGKKGLLFTEVKRTKDRVLIYVCRRSFLRRDLMNPGVQNFLAAYGYDGMDMDAAIAHLKERLAGSETFPHEIGLFLGYPLGDVIGYIENAGKNAKCCGCWSVYCDECEARKQFARFQKCKDIYKRLWNEGRSVWQLTVAA